MALQPSAASILHMLSRAKVVLSFIYTLQVQGDKDLVAIDTRSALVQLLVSHGADVQAQDQNVRASALAP